MPTRDNHSSQRVSDALAAVTIGSDTITNGIIIDTADYDMGVKFSVQVSAYTDGTFDVSFEHGEDPGLSDAAAVPANMFIGAPLSLTAATDVANWPSNGLHSTKRFVRMVITSTIVTTGATVQAIVTQHGEYNPQV